MRNTSTQPALLSSFLLLGACTSFLLLSACSSGSGAGSSSGGNPGDNTGDNSNDDPGPTVPDANSGGLEAVDFDYEDPNSEGFHPLRERAITLLERAEVTWIAGTNTAGRQLTTVDDLFSPDGPPPAYSVLAQGAASFADGYDIHDLCYANIDSDGEAELLALGVNPTNQMLSLRILDAGNGAPIASLDLGIQSNWVDGEIATGDLDGDGRHEVAITATFYPAGAFPSSWLFVFDDGEALFQPLISQLGGVETGEQRVQMGDLNGDGTAELVVLRTDADAWDPLASLHVFVFDEQGFVQLHSLTPPRGELEPLIPQENAGSITSFYTYAALEVADFDGDGASEIVIAAVDSGNYEVSIASYDGLDQDAIAPLAPLRPRTNLSVPGGVQVKRYGPEHGQSFLACDVSQEIGAELVHYAVNDDESNMRTGTLSHIENVADPTGSMGSDSFVIERQGLEQYNNPTGLVASDDDGDGLEEVMLLTQAGNASNSQLRLRRFEWVETYNGSTGQLEGEFVRTHRTLYTSNNFSGPVLLASGDADADGLGLRYTGMAFLEVADPIPLVVLVAPPSKADTSQVLTTTGASYSFSATSSVTREVSYSMSYSTQAGGSFGSIFKGNYARKSEEMYERSFGSTQFVTEFVEYNGIASDDYIIFHGLLVQRYVYEVMQAEDPALRGTEVVINVPVKAQQYFWTHDYYNNNVDPEAQIGSDVLGHTIGDPTSYATYEEVSALDGSGTDVVWWRTEGQTVPQGGGSSGHGFELGEESSTSGEFSISSSETIGGGVDLGFLEGGYSETTTHGNANLYTITLGAATTYSATVGGIPDTSEYESWAYSWGLYVHNYSSAEGRAFQVLDFWVTPVGTGY